MGPLLIGQVHVYPIQGGFFRLDGGTMFGVVPKTMWEKQAPADAHNRVRIACNCLLVRTPDVLAVIDSGFGTRLDARARSLYGVEEHPTLLQSLADAGAAPDDVDLVVLTHLHFDHLAGALYRDGADLKPTFPRATHCVQRGEWRDAIDGRSTMKSSYRPDDLQTLEEQVPLNLLYGDSELTPHLPPF